MKKIILAIFIVASIASCKKYENREGSVDLASEATADVISNATNPEVEGKIFKSNALIEMNVSDVMKNSMEIEDNAIQLNGFVLNSELTNQKIDSDEVELSADSVKKMDKIQRLNLIELKVPANKLREHVKFALEKGIIVDHILINNEEMTFEKYENDLKNDENKSVKISKQIENKVNKALINDAVNYATIAYKLSEEPHIVTTVIPQNKIKVYQEINFGYELQKSWKDGVYFFKMVFIFFFKFLPTILSISFLFFGIKYLIRYLKNRESNAKS